MLTEPHAKVNYGRHRPGARSDGAVAAGRCDTDPPRRGQFARIWLSIFVALEDPDKRTAPPGTKRIGGWIEFVKRPAKYAIRKQVDVAVRVTRARPGRRGNLAPYGVDFSDTPVRVTGSIGWKLRGGLLGPATTAEAQPNQTHAQNRHAGRLRGLNLQLKHHRIANEAWGVAQGGARQPVVICVRVTGSVSAGGDTDASEIQIIGPLGGGRDGIAVAIRRRVTIHQLNPVGPRGKRETSGERHIAESRGHRRVENGAQQLTAAQGRAGTHRRK